MIDDLNVRRHEAADREFENYNLGSAKLGEADGWVYEMPGLEYTRTLWFANDDDPEGADIKGHFTVRFTSETSAEVADAYACINGNDIGSRVAPAVSMR